MDPLVRALIQNVTIEVGGVKIYDDNESRDMMELLEYFKQTNGRKVVGYAGMIGQTEDGEPEFSGN